MPSILPNLIAGSDRSRLHESVAKGIAMTNDGPQEALLLEINAKMYLYEKASGTSVQLDFDAPALQSDASATYPTSEAINCLAMILYGNRAYLLSEWLSKANEKGLSLPPEFIPDVLDRSLRDKAFLSQIRQSKDARLIWMAQQKPEWGIVFPQLGQEDWFTASFETRLALLEIKRKQSPLVALALLEKTWPEESNEHKCAFLQTFQTGLSLSDASFLEKALRAKSRDVRVTAAAMLAQLPDSPFFMELNEALENCVGFIETPDFEQLIRAKIPDIGAPALKHIAGLIAAKETDTIRSGILLQVLNYAPPARLSQLLGWSPLDVLEAIQKDENKHYTLSGLLHATMLHRDEAWTAAFVQFLAARPDHALWQSDRLPSFFLKLSDPQWNLHLPTLCQNKQLIEKSDAALYKALTKSAHKWSRQMLRAVLETWLSAQHSPFGSAHLTWKYVLLHGALCCDPADAFEADTWLSTQKDLPLAAQADLRAFMDLANFRQKMI